MESLSESHPAPSSFLDDFKKCIANFEDSEDPNKGSNNTIMGGVKEEPRSPELSGDSQQEGTDKQRQESGSLKQDVQDNVQRQKHILLSALSASSSIKSEEDMASYHEENRKTLDASLSKVKVEGSFMAGNSQKPPSPLEGDSKGVNVTRYSIITGEIYQQNNEMPSVDEKSMNPMENFSNVAVASPSSPMNLVVNMKDYSCKVCRKPFDSRSSLRKHICRVDNEEDMVAENGYGEAPAAPDIESNLESGFIDRNPESEFAENGVEVIGGIKQSPLMVTQRKDLVAPSEMQYPAVEAMETQMPSADDQPLNIDIKSQPGQLFMCPICSMTFTQASVLTRHYRAHSNERPHECKDCHKAFRRKCHLKRHWQRIHSGEKPFKCGICGKAFSDRDHQRQHETIHGPETYPCLKCRSVFPTEQFLAAHVAEHPDCKAAFSASADNQIKRLRGAKGKNMPGSYRCGLCGDFFKKLRQIQTHQRVRHHDAFEKKYKCNICQKGFDLISDLTHHRSTHVLRGSKYDIDRETKTSSPPTTTQKKPVRLDGTETGGENKAELMQMLQQLEKRIQLQERRVQQMEHRQENMSDDFIDDRNDLENNGDEIGSKLRFMLERPMESPVSDLNSHEPMNQMQGQVPENGALDYSCRSKQGDSEADNLPTNVEASSESMNGMETQTKAVLDLMFRNRHKCKECGLSFLLYSEFRDHRKRHERARAAFGIEGGDTPKQISPQMICGNPDGDRNLCRDCCNEKEPHSVHSHTSEGTSASTSAVAEGDGEPSSKRIRTRSMSNSSRQATESPYVSVLKKSESCQRCNTYLEELQQEREDRMLLQEEVEGLRDVLIQFANFASKYPSLDNQLLALLQKNHSRLSKTLPAPEESPERQPNGSSSGRN